MVNSVSRRDDILLTAGKRSATCGNRKKRQFLPVVAGQNVIAHLDPQSQTLKNENKTLRNL